MTPKAFIYSPSGDRLAVAGNGLQFPALPTSVRVAMTLGTGDRGLLVWDQDLVAFYYWDGTQWLPLTGGGGGGTYQLVYTGATVSPMVAFWTITDGQATQVGLDAEVTTGTTVIAFGTGRTFDGVFDLTPIGATLATIGGTSCTFTSFTSGVLQNLSLFTFLGSSFGTLDLSGCQNALVVNLDQCTVTTLSLPPSLLLLTTIGTYGTIPLAGCVDVTTITIGGGTPTTVAFVTGLADCASLTSIGLNDVSSLATLNFGSLLAPFALTVTSCPDLTTINASGCSGATSISVTTAPLLTSLDVTGCTGLLGLAVTGANLASFDISTLSSLQSFSISPCGIVAISLGACQGPFTAALDDLTAATSIDASGCTFMTSLAIGGFAGAPLLTTLDVSGANALQVLTSNSPALTTVTLTNLPAVIEVQIPFASLDVASVNSILVAADANGLTNGIMNLGGGTSAAPTGAGATAAASLVGKGWIVTTN